ncbi:hypothetical protein [Streptomyces griseus]|uniref:hypothetical protein n=1 Tax=Streptomyces griseus TaxID=1911 RepID=UPI00056C8726|nr:hypothetical protein [Streptomyces griseus]
MNANLTILLICLAVLAAACYAMRRLSSTPARVVAVIFALATLVGALKPIVALLSEPLRAPAETVAPSMPITAGAEQNVRLTTTAPSTASGL